MNKFYKIWRVIAFALDALLVCDVASDLWKKYKDRKAKDQNEPATEEEEAPVAEEAPAL